MGSPVKEIYPVEDDTKIAARALARIISISPRSGNCDLNFEVSEKIKDGIIAMLEKIANEESVAILSLQREYSTNEAAEILRISRPFLTKILNKGGIPFRQVGSHRRIDAKDLFAYKEAQEKAKEDAFSRMTKLTQEIEDD